MAKPIVNSPITDHKWPDKGRKNPPIAKGKGPIAGSPIEHDKWPGGIGRKNK